MHQKCERTLGPRHGNMMAPVVTCLTRSLLPIVLVGEGSIKACLILGRGGADVRVVTVCTASSRWCWTEPLSRNLVGLFITYCAFLYLRHLCLTCLPHLCSSQIWSSCFTHQLEYPSIQWFWRSSSVSYLQVYNKKRMPW